MNVQLMFDQLCRLFFPRFLLMYRCGVTRKAQTQIPQQGPEFKEGQEGDEEAA